MKSISNSDPICCAIVCQNPIPRFLLISLKYLGLSTFLKAPDLIRPLSLIAAHFLWQDCQTPGALQGHSEVHGTSSSPSLRDRTWEEVTLLARAPSQGWRSRNRSNPEAEQEVLSVCLPFLYQGSRGPLSTLDPCAVTPSAIRTHLHGL